MYRIFKPDTAFRPSKSTKAVKDKAYLSFIHELPCLIELVTPVEAAHLSTANRLYGHTGRGKGSKVSDRWCLPLCMEKHIEQHQHNEMLFWSVNGINPHLAALTLHGLWSDMKDDAVPIARELIMKRELGRYE